MQSPQASKSPRKLIGWREWIALPNLHIDAIKAKIDTGARSSSLHALDIRLFEQEGKSMVKFRVHPYQRDTQRSIEVVTEIVDLRPVKSSSGHVTRRPVVRTLVELFGQQWPIDLTLAGRDAMGFRMLLGREAIRRWFWVDASKSYLAGRHSSSKGN